MPLTNWDNTEGRNTEWQFGKQIMFRTGDGYTTDLKVHGFLRKLYQTRHFKNVPSLPVVLIALIRSFYSHELIHWVNNDSHFAILLKDILSASSIEVEL